MTRAAVLLAAAAACRAERPYPPPDASELLAALDHHERTVRTLRAETRIEHAGEGGHVKGTVMVLVGPGGRLRLDALSPASTPLATLVSDGETFALLDAGEDRFLRGPAAPCNVARLIGIALDPADAGRVLTGSTPRLGGAGVDAGVRWDGRERHEVLSLRAPDGRAQEIRLEGPRGRWRLARSELRDPSGAVLLRVTPAEWRRQGGVDLPRRLDISAPARDRAIRIRFRRQDPNVELPDSLFRLDPPPGMPVEAADCP